MSTGDSPAVARRRLRMALRRAREAKDLTQGQVAKALDWSLSKVNRIESGDVTVSNTDLQALLRLLQVVDEDQAQQLMEDARASRRRGWWDEPRYREHLSPAMLLQLQFEGEASAIRCFQPTLVPGILQTHTYADAVINFWSDDLTELTREVRLEVRMRRREQVLERVIPPQYLVILDESVVLREVGGATVMADQLQEVLVVAQRPDVLIRILPLAKGALIGALGSFLIFDLGDEENAVLYREGNLVDEIVHSPEQLRRHRQIFEQMWEQSLTEETTVSLINARHAMLRASIDTGRSTLG